MTSLNAQAQVSGVTDYLDYFSLSDDPFATDLLPFYDGGLRRELFAELLHLCQFSASMLVVLGAEGVGKASLKTALCQHFGEHDLVGDIDVPVLSNSEWLLNSIAQQLSLQVDASDTGQTIAAIRQVVQQSDDDDCLKVVMVENAHNLDADSLTVLMRLAAHGDQSPYRQLHLLLFANPEFEHRLPQDEGQGLVQVFRLPPIAPNEMKHYLRFRLDAVGFSGIFPFKDADIQFLWDISKGVPAKFHDAAREILIELASPPPENKSMGLPATHMAAIVLLLAGLLAVVFYSGTSSYVDGDKPGNEIAQTQLAPPIQPTPQTPTDVAQSSASATNTANALQENDEQDQQAAEPPIAIEPVTSEPKVSPQAAVATRSPVPEPVKPSPSPNVSTPVGSRPTEQDIDALLAAAEKELAQEKITTPASAQRKPAPSNLTQDENALLNRSPNNFTLQILASGSRQAVDDFLARQSNRNDLAVFTAKRDGNTLYIVVMGSFPSSDAARLAVNKLPQEQRTAGPWPRSFQSVQADIREFRGF